MDRNLFFNKVTVDGIQELDFLDNSLAGFELKRTPTYYRVKEQDLVRPDIISYKFYGSVEFWWFVMIVNNISDIKEEITAGVLLKLPHVLDIYDYFKSKRKR